MLKALRTLAIAVAVCAALIVGLRIAYPLPELPRTPSPAVVSSGQEGGLSEIIAPHLAAHPGTSGIAMLESGADAFAARIQLVRAARVSIDAQYYIWSDDLTGIRLLTELQEASHRGVHVRLLVDDNGTPALDQELAALDALPNAEVRIFNPFTLRDYRFINYAFDFFRLNRRMHNKSLTVDGSVTIVGGRNIADTYFETGSELTYVDLDVLAIGPAARDVSIDFNRYWASRSSYSAQSLITLLPNAEFKLTERNTVLSNTEEGRNYRKIIHASSFVDNLLNMTMPLEWVPTLLFSDDPAKALGLDEGSDRLVPRLFAEIGTPERSLDIISAYFIPGTPATEQLAGYVAAGVRVRTLTNALETTDVAVVHSGYAPYRRVLLEGGIEVYEMRSDGGEPRTVVELGLSNISEAALHAKSLSVDRRRAFIGSLNLDPRSKRLNTEMGLLIDSTLIASRISDQLDSKLAEYSYRVSLNDKGAMVWTTQNRDGDIVVYDYEPNTTLPLRLLVRFISILPVQWLL